MKISLKLLLIIALQIRGYLFAPIFIRQYENPFDHFSMLAVISRIVSAIIR